MKTKLHIHCFSTAFAATLLLGGAVSVATAEFVRRFALHVLPERFVKIRHYGLLGNRHKQARLAQAPDW